MANGVKTVFFLESDESFCRKVKLIIDAHLGDSIKVFCAHSLEDAAKLINLAYVDIFVVDLDLPDGNGLDFIRQIRKSEVYEHNMLIVTTNETDAAEQINMNNELDVYSFLARPYAPEDVLPILERAVKKTAQRYGRYMVLKRGAKTFKIDANNVILVDKIPGDKQIQVHMISPEDDMVTIHNFPMQSMEIFTGLLSDQRDLIRVNQSTFVNPRFVVFYDGIENELHLRHTNRLVTIGRSYKVNIGFVFKYS